MVFNFNEEFKNKNIVTNSIKNAFEDKSIDKIDIVLFFFSEGNSLENAVDILKILNEKQFIVLFIINRSIDEEENGKNKEITATISFLKKNKFNNLIKEKNFIPCNLKSSKRMKFYGMKEIWERIYNVFQEENELMNDNDNNLKNKMRDYMKLFEELKNEMNINEQEHNLQKIDKIKKDLKKNKLFSKINEKTIEEKCLSMTNKCCNTFNPLSSLKYEQKIDDIEIIYILEAILFLEIGKYFGFRNDQIKDKFYKLKESLDEYYENEYSYKKKKEKNKTKKK